MKKIIILIALILLSLPMILISFPYDMYSGMTGKLTLGVTGYIDSRNIGKDNVEFSTPVSLNFGITRNIDIFARVLPISYLPKVEIGTPRNQFSIMPRFQFIEGLIGAVEFLIPSSKDQYFGISPQLHYLGGLGDFLSGFINLETTIFPDNPLGVVESLRLKGALAFYPGSFLGFSLLGFYIEYHFAYNFYEDYVGYLDHLGVGVYLAFNNDATFGISLSPFVNQVGDNFGFGIGMWIYYAYDINKHFQ